jgi:hypothetical protein
VPDRAADDDVDALHRDAAAGGGVAEDDEQAAVRARSGRLARVPVHDHGARHHVLRDARPGVAADADRRPLVHPGAVVADVAVDLDLDVRVDPAGDGVGAVGIEPTQVPRPSAVRGEVVETLVQVAKPRRGEVDGLEPGRDAHPTRAVAQW